MRLAAILALLAAPAAAQQVPCGGDFAAFKEGLVQEAAQRGHDPATARAFLAGARQDPATLRADGAQGVFQLPFLDFSRRVISQGRIDNGRRNEAAQAAVFDRIEAEYGVPRGILLAFWALETDYGAVQGDFNTLNSLVTLAHDCRRPELFRPQVLAALELHERGDFDPARTTGAWAGEVGMVQMLPEDIIENGRDGDGDGHVSLKTSPPDALTSGASMLRSLGWRPGEPWLEEVVVPQGMDWSRTGLNHPMPAGDWALLGVQAWDGRIDRPDLPAALLLPQGRRGPAFLAYPNFEVLFEWNQSFVYVTTAAYFATRLEGAPVYAAGDPEPGLDDAQMIRLQEKLARRGHDVGGIDGILGERTREAVQAEQARLGLPADAWPTRALLDAL